MSNYLVAPLGGETIKVLCIDETKVRSVEDGFRITRAGKRTQIDIVCPIPPREKVMPERVILSLYKLAKKPDKSIRHFLSRTEQINFGINENSPSEVLVATYIIDQDDGLILEELSTARAIGIRRSYTDYGLSFDSATDRLDFSKVLATKSELKRHTARPKSVDFITSPRAAYQIVMMSIHLFNMTCRNAARQVGVPFLAKKPSGLPGKHLYLNNNNAVFKSTLRNPIALANTYNIVDALYDRPLTFPEAYLRKRLPIIQRQSLS